MTAPEKIWVNKEVAQRYYQYEHSKRQGYVREDYYAELEEQFRDANNTYEDLKQAVRRLLDNIYEFGQPTDGEFLNDLERFFPDV